MKNIAMIILAAAFSLTACRKEVAPTATDQKATLAYKTLSAYQHSPGNPANPYDSIGYLHNRGLDSLRKYVRTTGDTSRQGRASYLKSYAAQYHMSGFMPSGKMEPDICTDYKSVLLDVPYSAGCKRKLQQMVDVLEQVQSTGGFAGYRKKITAIEQDILAGHFVPEEKAYMLIVASVLRHSGYYWMDAFENNHVTQKKGMLGFLRKVAGVIAAIGADATTAGWHYVKNSPYDLLVLESIWMSEVCGYYTGWW